MPNEDIHSVRCPSGDPNATAMLTVGLIADRQALLAALEAATTMDDLRPIIRRLLGG